MGGVLKRRNDQCSIFSVQFFLSQLCQRRPREATAGIALAASWSCRGHAIKRTKRMPRRACRAGRQSIPPEILEPIRRQLGIAHRVLDVLVSHPRLNSAGIMAGFRERIATPVPKHVRVDREWHPGAHAQPHHKRMEALGRNRTASFRSKDIRAGRLFALQAAQGTDLVISDWMDARGASLASADVQAPGPLSSTWCHCRSQTSEARRPCR